MNIIDIAEKIADKHGITKTSARKFTDELFLETSMMLELGHPIRIAGFGFLKTIHAKARIGRNPKKPETAVLIPARRRIVFKQSKEQKNVIDK